METVHTRSKSKGPRLSLLDCTNVSDLSALQLLFKQFETSLLQQESKLSRKWTELPSSQITIDTPYIIEFLNNIGNKPNHSDSQTSALDLLHQITKLFDTTSSHITTSNINNNPNNNSSNNDNSHPSSNDRPKSARFRSPLKIDLSEIKSAQDDDENTSNEILLKQLELQRLTGSQEMKKIKEQKAIIAEELAKVEPKLKAAQDAVLHIDRSQLIELLSMQKPPKTVELVLSVAGLIMYEHELENGIQFSNKTPKTPKYFSSNNNKRHKGGAHSVDDAFGVDVSLDDNNTNNNNRSRSSAKTPKASSKRSSSSSSSRGLGGNGNNFSDDNGNIKKEFKRAKTPKPRRGGKGGSGTFEKRIDFMAQSWKEIRKYLINHNFREEIMKFDPSHINEEVYDKIATQYLIQEHFDLERATKASKVLGPLVQWICSIDEYRKIYRRIEPMIKQVEQLELELLAQQQKKQIMKHKIDSLSIEAKQADEDENENDNDNDTKNAEEEQFELDDKLTGAANSTNNSPPVTIDENDVENMNNIAAMLRQLEIKLKLAFSQPQPVQIFNNNTAQMVNNESGNNNTKTTVISNEIMSPGVDLGPLTNWMKSIEDMINNLKLTVADDLNKLDTSHKLSEKELNKHIELMQNNISSINKEVTVTAVTTTTMSKSFDNYINSLNRAYKAIKRSSEISTTIQEPLIANNGVNNGIDDGNQIGGVNKGVGGGQVPVHVQVIEEKNPKDRRHSDIDDDKDGDGNKDDTGIIKGINGVFGSKGKTTDEPDVPTIYSDNSGNNMYEKNIDKSDGILKYGMGDPLYQLNNIKDEIEKLLREVNHTVNGLSDEIDQKQLVLKPRKYFMEQNWCCGWICCLKYACGFSCSGDDDETCCVCC